MQRCIRLARLGAGAVAPNPMVGAVLVYNNMIIGEGCHQQYGYPHAEVNCINSVAADNQKYIPYSTLYVSLEPCSHFGKTPPCTNLISASKIPEVVIGCVDSFAEVNGSGIKKLESAGIKVTVPLLEKECLDLNKRFFTFHQQKRPYVILKWAQSSDGKMGSAGADRLLISNECSNRQVHKWRSEEAAILVGTNTALLDDPALSTRHWPGQNPVRLVIDKELRLPGHLQLFDGTNRTVVFNHIKDGYEGMIQYCQLSKQPGFLEELLSSLYEMKLQSVLVEGGARLLQSFIDAGLWDEARVISNQELVIGDGIAAPILKDHQLSKEEMMDTDVISLFIKKGNNE